MSREIQIGQAASEILATTKFHQPRRPFFFVVGAGVSVPSVPQASGIVAECRDRRPDLAPPADLKPIAEYEWWFEQAFPSPADRQSYLRGLIKDRAVTQANLHLAHLLQSRKLATLVVTLNFDDYITRALNLFGEPHVVCDHPETIQRIDPEVDDVQVVHVHGTYWFYDCINLTTEIKERSRRAEESAFSMRDFLESLLESRSPIVVGYSGWEEDVFMTALRRKLGLARARKFNLFWCCYRRDQVDKLPQWLRDHPSVRFVVPPKEASPGEAREARPQQQQDTARRVEPSLPAVSVFRELITTFNIDVPPLTQDPLDFLAGQLRRSLPAPDGVEAPADIYQLANIVHDVARARELLLDAKNKGGRAQKECAEKLAKAQNALRRLQHREAVQAASGIAVDAMNPQQAADLLTAMFTAATGLFDNSPEELEAYDLVIAAAGRIGALSDDQSHTLSMAMVNKGLTLSALNRPEEEIVVYEAIIERFGDTQDSRVREQLAKAMFNRAVTLGQVGRPEEEIAAYDQLVARLAGAVEPTVRRQVATALRNKGVQLGDMGRGPEAIEAFDALLKLYGDASEQAVREQVATAMGNKGYRLGAMGQHEQAIAVYEEIVKRFSGATEPALRRELAQAIYNQGVTLSDMGRRDEAIAAYEEVSKQFGDDPALHVQVAKALVNQGYTLGESERSEEAIEVYDRVAERFGDSTEPAMQDQVARALYNKGGALRDLDRPAEALPVYDALAARYGGATEPVLRERVAKGLLNKGVTLSGLGRIIDATATFNDVAARFGDDDSPGLVEIVAKARKNRDDLQGGAAANSGN